MFISKGQVQQHTSTLYILKNEEGFCELIANDLQDVFNEEGYRIVKYSLLYILKRNENIITFAYLNSKYHGKFTLETDDRAA